jgi:hypothetical protein
MHLLLALLLLLLHIKRSKAGALWVLRGLLLLL